MDWTAAFRPDTSPDKEPDESSLTDATPAIFEGKEHAAAIYEERVANGQRIFAVGDDFAWNVHSRIGVAAIDVLLNGSFTPKLSPQGEVYDPDEDNDASLGDWTVRKAIDSFRIHGKDATDAAKPLARRCRSRD